MRTYGKRALAALLALFMLLALTACNDSTAKDGTADGESSGLLGWLTGLWKKDDAQQLPAKVYVPEFLSLDLDLLGKDFYLSSGCTDGTNVYLLCSVYPDYEAGETGDSRYTVVRIPLDGGEPAELENFTPAKKPEGYDEGNVNYDNLRVGADGSLWVAESAYAYKYDLPEDFDPETDYAWNYDMLENVELNYQVQLDATGAEITRIDTSSLREKAEVEYFYSEGTIIDKDGDIFVCSQGKVVVLDSAMNVRFTVEDESLWGDDMVLLSDGTVGALVTVRDTIDDTYSRQVRAIDKSTKKWGEAYDVPTNAYNIYGGGGEYLFYYKNGEALYGYKAEAEEGAERGERLLSWLDADIDSDGIEFFSFLEDGRVVVMTRSWYGNGGPEYNLAILAAKDRDQIPEKVTLTYATMYLGQDERNRILTFNKNSATHRIQVTDYSEYATDEDYMAGITKLNAEILAGKVPDILSVDSLPLRQYGAKGVLEDLWPYIDNDPELGREKLMDRVFTAAEQDGKLYQVFDSFSIQTIVGSSKVVGGNMGWTMREFQNALASMPEGCSPFGVSSTKSGVLSTMLAQNLDSFINWETGECFFDSDNFKTALAFCDTFPLEFDYSSYEYSSEDSDTTRIAEGRQMLVQAYLSDFRSLQRYEAMFGGMDALQHFYLSYNYGPNGYTVEVTDVPVVDQWGGTNESNRVIPGRYVTFKGYPMEDGSCGSAFNISGGLAMSSACKDKETAWSFIRQLLLPEEEDSRYYRWNFPVNKADFDKMAEDAMKVEYMTDGEGNPVLDLDGNPIEESQGGWSWDDMMIDIRATSQSEYDQIMELYNAIDSVYSYDTKIFEIVTDVAGSYFAGDKPLEDAASLIQNRVNTYVNESR